MAEQESLGPEQVNEFLFMQLVMMFQGAAYQQMGKVMNPATQKVERNLEQAKGSIDMLGMLEEKTKGNLSENENRMLEHVLYELRMNYVDELNKGETEAGADQEGAGEEAEGADAEGGEGAAAEGEEEEAGSQEETEKEGGTA